jgi:uncharacterized protein (TIGR03435 family)
MWNILRQISVFALVVTASALAQTPAFEVASIRPAQDDGDHDSDVNRGRVLTHNVTLKFLIARAWDVDENIVLGGPKWVHSDGWDINAKIPAEFSKATPDQMKQMIADLLATRFHLAIHRESRRVAGYNLVLATGPPRMMPTEDSSSGSGFSSHNNLLKAHYATMDQFARRLSRNRDVGKLVVNNTGLGEDRHFDFELEWAAADGKTESDKPIIFTALQQQLGLKLSSAKITAETIIIDRAERPDEN